MHHGNGWLQDRANRPWIVLGLVIAIIVVIAGAYVWSTRVQPVLDRMMDQEPAALLLR
ncbi:hypothetical protein HER39_07440 [Arthrobacter deserti]|uniref:Uncharacterized protein n=1 Tax=Arthrobacter deserti TaxID=1742687 RepID=A0ABX1JMP2_9MICC|nr:hypothetical protein [Arthrobacter deserti]